MVRTDNLASFTGGNNGAVLEVTQTTNGQRKRLFDLISIVPLTANTWGKVEHTFTTPATLTSEVVEVKLMLLRNGRLWVSQPMMNQGSVAADYTANIKDIQLSLAQIKVTANTISQSITDLSTGLENVGIHLSGTEKKITLHGDTEMVGANGKRVAMFKDGKISTDTIDADKIVAKGIQGKTIDAKDATFENVNVSGNLNVRRLSLQASDHDGSTPCGSFITGSGTFMLPLLKQGQFMHITIFNILETRVPISLDIKVSRASDCIRYEKDNLLSPAGDELISSLVWGEMIGVGRENFTIWTIKGENIPRTLYKNGICINEN